MNNSALLLACVGAAAVGFWWSRRREEESTPAISVRGGNVTVANVEAIEEARVWRYIGPKAWVVPNAQGLNAIRPGSLLLTPGSYYDAQPVMPGKWGTRPDVLLMEEKGAPTIYGPSVGRLDPEADTWASWWEQTILTVAEQLAVGLVVPVPEGLR